MKSKKLSRFTCIIIAALFILNSCKKEQELSITGKWKALGYEQNDFYNGMSHYSSGSANPGSYLELKSDNTVVAYSTSAFSSGTWSRQGNKLTVVSSSGITESWVINKHTSSELVLYQTDKDVYPTDYYEITVFFSR